MRVFEDICLPYEEKTRALAFELREFLLSQLNDIKEEIDPRLNMAFFSYGKGYKNLICMLSVSKEGVKLGFYKGWEFDDPLKLMKGKGKVHSHIEVKDLNPKTKEVLKDFLSQALIAYNKRK